MGQGVDYEGEFFGVIELFCVLIVVTVTDTRVVYICSSLYSCTPQSKFYSEQIDK